MKNNPTKLLLKASWLSAVRGEFEARSEAVQLAPRASAAKINKEMHQQANWCDWQSQTAELAAKGV